MGRASCPGCRALRRRVAELEAIVRDLLAQLGRHAAIPAEVRAHVVGPRLSAAITYLSGGRHDSKRGVEEVVETLFGVPVSLGTVAAVEQEVSAALAAAHAEAVAAVRAAPVKNVDETGWKQAGRLCWLWAGVTRVVACFQVHARRGLEGLRTFAHVEGVEPTNNAAERAVRPVVLWRKRSFGCHSEAGCRYVERILTVVQTLRRQGRPVFAFLVDIITAHRQGQPTPQLLPVR